MNAGLMKSHHGIMKHDAQDDYDRVYVHCVNLGLPLVEPKGKSWQKIEDATAEMITNIEDKDPIKNWLHRGINYYCSLTK